MTLLETLPATLARSQRKSQAVQGAQQSGKALVARFYLGASIWTLMQTSLLSGRGRVVRHRDLLKRSCGSLKIQQHLSCPFLSMNCSRADGGGGFRFFVVVFVVGVQLAMWMLNDRLMELLFSAEFLHTETLKRWVGCRGRLSFWCFCVLRFLRVMACRSPGVSGAEAGDRCKVVATNASKKKTFPRGGRGAG